MEENKDINTEETPEEKTEEAVNEETKTDDAAKAEEYRDKFLRVSAEFDNFRKRTVKEKETLYSDGMAAAALEFLPLADNMERAVTAAVTDGASDAMKEGMEKIHKQLREILKCLGVEEIKAVGEKFDPELHNAVMHIEDPDKGDGVIAEEFQKGYLMNGKVLRHSMVSVAN